MPKTKPLWLKERDRIRDHGTTLDQPAEPIMKMFDLFCGYGGASQPFVDHGWEVVGFDNEPRVASRYPGKLILQDVSTIDGQHLQGADLIWASPPCIHFTLANQRVGNQRDLERGMELVRDAKRIIDQAEPRHWIIENVRGSVRSISELLGRPINLGGPNNQAYWFWTDLHPILPMMRKSFRSSDPRNRAIIPYPIADAVRRAVPPVESGRSKWQESATNSRGFPQ